MKLSTKIQRRSLFLLPVYFIFAVVVIFFVVKLYLHENIEERLLFLKETITEQMLQNEFPNFKGFIEITETDSLNISALQFSDITIYDPIEEEQIPFKQLIFYASIKNTNYKIIITQPLGETEQIITDLTKGILIIFIVFISLNYFTTLRLNKRIWLPFYKNLKRIKSYDIKNSEILDFEQTDIDEFNDLNNVITKMTKKIENDYINLKSFTENASHEIQTPIAVIKSNVELLLQTDQLSKTQMEYLINIEEYATKLTKLNRSLLLLSKIENKQFIDQDKVNLQIIINKQVDLLSEQFEFKEIKVETNIKESREIYANHLLIEVLIQNLVKNAMRYCNRNGQIILELSANIFSISNTGKPLTIASEQLFERFKKDNQSDDSLGLGLAIVKKICEQFDFQISYTYENNFHKFKIVF